MFTDVALTILNYSLSQIYFSYNYLNYCCNSNLEVSVYHIRGG